MMNRYEERRKRLQNIFQDTMNCVEKNDQLKKATERMAQSTIIYKYEMKVFPESRKSSGNNIEVVEDTSFSCARKHTREGRVAVLNFANSIHLGGGVVRGALAQEECLCRSSNLYKALTTELMLREYYKRNRRYDDSIGSDTVAYHSGVTVFKDDEVYAKLLAPEDWFEVDVITCAAPRIITFSPISDEELYHIHVKRGRRIIMAAVENNAEVLILGAFGCGAFNNNPTVVAKAYRHLLQEEGYANSFKKVIFAIKKDHNDVKGNYHCFKKVFFPE